mgnify:CR=1 FL=1
MPEKTVFDEMLEYGVMMILVIGVSFIFLPSKYPKLSILIVPAVALLFLAGNVPNLIIFGWIISAGVWFTIPIWLPLSKGDAPFTKPN